MLKQQIQSTLAIIFLILAVYSCANMSTPTGGAKDEDPPIFVRSTPEPNALNYKKNKIEIFFDENIQLDKVAEKLLVSPPQKEMPIVKSSGKRLSVEIKDTLQNNTTYTIDFADAIADNNEKNALENFVFSFSTGEVIDSLEISGILLNAADLEPITGKLVGVHKNLHDTAFTTEPFYRIASTDSYGKFSIKNLSEGTYRVYALNDLNRDYKFDQSGEDIAFSDSLFAPHFEVRIKNDTIWKDSITVDTVHAHEYTHYLPDDILLRFFKETAVKNQFLQKQERLTPTKFSLFFNAPSDILPKIKPLNFTSDDWFVLEANATNDTLHYWIKNQSVIENDTLSLQVEYLKTDTAKQLVPTTDTLFVAIRKTRQTQKEKKKEAEQDSVSIEFFKPNIKVSGTLDINQPIFIEWESPVDSYNPEGIHLEIKSDTIWEPFNFTFEPDTSQNIRTYKLSTKWVPNAEYQFLVDSAAFVSIYDTHNKELKTQFRTKRLEDYGFIFFNLSQVDTTAFVELLDKSDKVIQRSPVKNNLAEFLFLKPGTYYARIIIDTNNNGIWDTGNYAQKIQPEMVYYYPGSIQLMANFEIEQDWNVLEVPLEEQKPKDLIKNKPKEKTSSTTQRRDR